MISAEVNYGVIGKLRVSNMEIGHERYFRRSDDDVQLMITSMCWLSDALFKGMRWQEAVELFNLAIVGLVEVNINIPKNQNYRGEFGESCKKVGELREESGTNGDWSRTINDEKK